MLLAFAGFRRDESGNAHDKARYPDAKCTSAPGLRSTPVPAENQKSPRKLQLRCNRCRPPRLAKPRRPSPQPWLRPAKLARAQSHPDVSNFVPDLEGQEMPGRRRQSVARWSRLPERQPPPRHNYLPAPTACRPVTRHTHVPHNLAQTRAGDAHARAIRSPVPDRRVAATQSSASTRNAPPPAFAHAQENPGVLAPETPRFRRLCRSIAPTSKAVAGLPAPAPLAGPLPTTIRMPRPKPVSARSPAPLEAHAAPVTDC